MLESHPFEPWLPGNAKLLMLGTFPPAEKRWCMPWYYPNFQNDMWRIFGIIYFDDKFHFVDVEHKTYRLDAIKEFLMQKGVAIYDTAQQVIRTKNTASDKDSQVADLPTTHPTRLYRNNQSPACLPSCVTPSLKQSLPVLEYLPVVHLLRSMPRIRSRLTLGRRSLPRNPYAFGGMDSHHSFRYSYQHSHFCEVHRSLQNDFSPHRTLPYPTTYVVATASVSYFSPGNLRRRVSRPVSYYALFKWWLLLSQHPGCFRDPTSFST